MKIPLELKLTENENRRQAFRVEVDGEVNVRMTLNDHPVKLLDISATGVAFETDQQLSGDLQGVEIYFEVSKNTASNPACMFRSALMAVVGLNLTAFPSVPTWHWQNWLWPYRKPESVMSDV